MKISFLVIFIFALGAYGQDHKKLNEFPPAFESALDKDFSEEQFQNLYSGYSALLSADDEVARPDIDPKRSDTKIYPLYDFKNSKLYTDNIDKLLSSSNPNQRLLAVMIIGAAGDTLREGILLEKLRTEAKYPGILIHVGMALMQLKTAHTLELFDFLVKYEEFGDAHMIPFFFGLDPEKLQRTAYERIGGNTEREKILAAQTLAITVPNTKTERLLKEAVKDWDIKIKGYAVYSLGRLRTGNLLDVLEPLVKSPTTRSISLAALANSPTERDRKFVVDLAEKEDPISFELLNSLFESKNPKNLSHWLKFLYSKKTPPKYIIWTNEQPLLASNDLLPELQVALRKITDPKLLAQLIEALRGRVDAESIDIVISLLSHPDPSVRYFAASVTRENPAKRLKEPRIKKLIDENLRN